jgi:hypothetical protein
MKTMDVFGKAQKEIKFICIGLRMDSVVPLLVSVDSHSQVRRGGMWVLVSFWQTINGYVRKRWNRKNVGARRKRKD